MKKAVIALTVLLAAVVIFFSVRMIAFPPNKGIIGKYELNPMQTLIRGMPVAEIRDRDGILKDFRDDGKCIIVGGISNCEQYAGKNLIVISTYSSTSPLETIIEIKDPDFRDYEGFFKNGAEVDYEILLRHR